MISEQALKTEADLCEGQANVVAHVLVEVKRNTLERGDDRRHVRKQQLGAVERHDTEGADRCCFLVQKAGFNIHSYELLLTVV